MIDVLLVNPPSPDRSVIIRDFNRSGRTSKEGIIWPQINLAYLAAMVPQNLSVEIVDCIAERISWPKFLEILNKKQPRYLVSHVITSTSTNDFKVFMEAKKIGAYTITMGPHVTQLPKESLQQYPDLDFIMMQEPEFTFKELIEILEKKSTQFDLSQILGLAWRKGNQIIINQPRPYLENLDELPLPRHDLLPVKKYVFPLIANSFTFVVASRGCPFQCTFCRQPIMWSRLVRTRSAASLMQELRWLKQNHIINFIFQTDTFTIKKEIVHELCRMMIEEKLNMSWACNSRVDTVDEETLKLMKEAGCWMIAYGFESGSDEVLTKCKKGTTVQQNRELARLTAEIGIKVYGYFIIGLIGETKETIKQTINFAFSEPITFAIFHVASPYPGTELYREVVANNWLASNHWEDINQGGTSPINYPNLSGQEIMQGIRQAYRSFYLRPQKLFGILTSIRNYADLKNLIVSGYRLLFWK